MVDRCRETMHHSCNASMFIFSEITWYRYALSGDNLEANHMPRKIVDLSARSRIIREEPWHLHFWESTAEEALAY